MKRLREHANASIVFGLVGMVTGTLGLFIAWQSNSQQAAVVLTAYPSAAPTDLTHAGLGVRTQLVNQSLRPVIVRSAYLSVGGTKVSNATGYLDDVRLLDHASLDPAAISDQRLDFPLSLNAREGKSVAFLMDVWRPIVAAGSEAAAVGARRTLNELLGRIGSLARTANTGRIELVLDLVPGGRQRFPVRALSEPGVYSEAIHDASAIQRQAPLPNWTVEPLVRGGRFVGLDLRRAFAGTGQVDLVRLDLWRERSIYHRSLVRPVLGQQSELFVLPNLPQGDYVAAFSLGQQVLTYRAFGLPWREDRCGGTVAGPVWCPLARRR